jgi:hypothetical protein
VGDPLTFGRRTAVIWRLRRLDRSVSSSAKILSGTLANRSEDGNLRLDLLMLARHAEVRDGLLNLLGGGWDTLTVPDGQSQATLNGSVALRVLFEPPETGRSHTMRVVIAGEDGAEHGDFGGDVEVPPGPGEQNVSLSLQISGLGLPAPGRYAVRLEVDGAVLGERRFRVERQ